MEPTVNSNLSFLVAEIFVFLNYSKIMLLRQENIRIMLAVLLLEKGKNYAQFLSSDYAKNYASTIGKSLSVRGGGGREGYNPIYPCCGSQVAMGRWGGEGGLQSCLSVLWQPSGDGAGGGGGGFT